MTTRYYFNAQGNYLGGFSSVYINGTETDHPSVPATAVGYSLEGPDHVLQKWNFELYKFDPLEG